MKCCFQFIDKNSGQRSKPFILTQRELADELLVKQEKENVDLTSFYVLCVGTISDDSSLELVDYPLILASTYFEKFL